MATSPDTAATSMPTKIGPSSAAVTPASIAAGVSSTAEPKMDGIEIKNTNFTANLRSRLQIKLPNRVEPDREIPGQIATPCTRPIKIALRKFIC